MIGDTWWLTKKKNEKLTSRFNANAGWKVIKKMSMNDILLKSILCIQISWMRKRERERPSWQTRVDVNTLFFISSLSHRKSNHDFINLSNGIAQKIASLKKKMNIWTQMSAFIKMNLWTAKRVSARQNQVTFFFLYDMIDEVVLVFIQKKIVVLKRNAIQRASVYIWK